jgi:mannosyltransferase
MLNTRQRPRGKFTLPEVAGCSAVGIVACVLFVYHVPSLSLWYDETFSVSLSNQPLPILAQAHEANMLLYTVLLRIWLSVSALVGIAPTPLVTRLPSIVPMMFAAIAIALIGSRLWSLATGLVASLLFILNGIVITQAQTARGYALQTLLVCLSWGALFIALKKPSIKRLWIIYAVLVIAAVYADVLSIFSLAAQVVGVAILFVPVVARRAEEFPALRTADRRSFAIGGLLAVLLIGAACLPLAVDATTHRGDNSWVPIATPDALGSFISSQTAAHLLPAIALVAAWLLGMALGLSIRRGLLVLLISWALVPVIGQYLTTQPALDLHFFFPKYLIATLPAFSLLAAIGIMSLRPYWAAAGLTLILVAQLAQTPISYYPRAERQPFIETFGWLLHHYQAGDGIICRPAKSCGVPASYYVGQLYAGRGLPTEFPGSWEWDRQSTTSTSFTALSGYLRGRDHVFVITVPHEAAAPSTVHDDIPTSLRTLGFSLTQSYRPGTSGFAGDVQVDEYSRTLPGIASSHQASAIIASYAEVRRRLTKDN